MSKLVEVLGPEGLKGRSSSRLIDRFIAKIAPPDLLQKVKIQYWTEMRTARQLYEMLKHGIILIDPDLQRRYVWDNVTASRFIESIIFHMPIPPIMLLIVGESKYYVIDGLQRLTTIYRFFEDKLVLRGVSNSELEYRRYSKLPDKYKERLDYASTVPVTFVKIEAEEPRYRLFFVYELFRRVNMGVKPPTARQILYCTFLTPVVYWARQVALSEATRYLFKEADYRQFRHCDFALSMLETLYSDRISPLPIMQDLTTLEFITKLGEEEAQKLAEDALRLVEKWRTLGITREHFTPAFYGLANSKSLSRLLVHVVTYITKPLLEAEVTPGLKARVHAILASLKGENQVNGSLLREAYALKSRKPEKTAEVFRKVAEEARSLLLQQ